jgi:HAMP domain-containing protein
MERTSFGWQSIRLRLFALFALVVIGAAYYAIGDLRREWNAMHDLDRLAALGQVSISASAVAHEFQKERGLAAGFIGSRGARFGAELQAQRALSVKSVEAYRGVLTGLDMDLLGEAFQAQVRSVDDALRAVEAIRSEITAGRATPAASFGAYTTAIEQLLAIVERGASSASNADISREITAYLMYLNAKEQAGRERATMNGVFTADSFEPATFRRFLTLLATQETYLHAFEIFASEDDWGRHQAVLASNASKAVDAMRKTAMDNALGGGFEIDPATWFAQITAKIDAMKQVEDELATHIAQLIDAVARDARGNFWQSVITMAVMLIVALLFGWQVSRMLGALHQTAVSAKRIAAGELEREIPVPLNNELGEIDQALIDVRNNVHAMVDDAAMLSQAAVEGRLATRAEAARHHGD